MFRTKLFMAVSLALFACVQTAVAQTVKTIKLKTGVQMNYTEQGNASGTPVVLLHGITDSMHSFDPVLPHLPPSWRVFALSLRGHGDSSRPANGYTPRDFAADVAAFLDTQKIPRAIIVGHSMGSFVAQRFALDFPTRTQALVLAGSFPTLRGHEGIQEFWDTTIARLQDPIDPKMVRGFQESTLHQPIPPAFLNLVVKESLKLPARVWREAFAGLMQADHRAELGRITAPTLIVWGEKETYFLRRDQDALVAAIKNTRFVVWPDAGHALHWEHPLRFADEVINFIESLAPQAQSRALQSVRLSTGVTMQYVEQGKAAGTPVVLVHGYPDSLHSFDLVLPHLPSSLHVFAISLRGFGDSSRPRQGYTLRDFTADVAAFLDARKIPRAVIVGHSMGSYIAQRFALDYPQRTQALMLIGSFTTLRGHPGLTEFWNTTVAKLRDPLDVKMVRGFQKDTLHQPISPAFFEQMVQESLKAPARVWRASLAALLQADHHAELGRIIAPTLIVWGEKETLCLRPAQEALLAAIKGSRLVVVPNAGHSLHWEQPQRLADELTNFIEHLFTTGEIR